METSSGVFKGILDRFQGITVESEHEYNATDDFPEKLKSIISSFSYLNRNVYIRKNSLIFRIFRSLAEETKPCNMV